MIILECGQACLRAVNSLECLATCSEKSPLRTEPINLEYIRFMKVKYLSLFAAIALLSVGGLVACGGSEAPETDGAATETVAPCAGKADPCAGKADPCAGKADPCAAKTEKK